MNISKPRWLTLTPLFSALLLTVAACGGQTQTVTVSEPSKPPAGKTYAATPEAAGQLLDDIKTVVQQQISTGPGVHFKMDSLTTASGATLSSKGEGDMILPSRLKMTTTNDIGGQIIAVDIIVIGSQIYTNSAATGGVWKSSNTPGMAPAEPSALTSYLDFTRSQRYLGEESLANGQRSYHLEIEVDSVKSTEAAKQKTSDPALRLALDATKTATVTVDLWIGVDDLRIYRQKVKTTNAATAISSELNFVFSDWGKPVEIERPCESC